jgi:hypothetical protein
MKNYLWKGTFALAWIASLTSLPSFASNDSPVSPVIATEAVNRQIDLRAQADFSVASIKDHRDLTAYLAKHSQNSFHESPLSALSISSRERFVRSVVFGEAGVGSFYYGDMRAELSPSQTYAILALFGAQLLAPIVGGAYSTTEADEAVLKMQRPPGDHEDKYCARKGTCRSESFAVCTSSC